VKDEQEILRARRGQEPLGAYDRVSIGFPGVVRAGRILIAPNLGNDAWTGFHLDTALTKASRADRSAR